MEELTEKEKLLINLFKSIQMQEDAAMVTMLCIVGNEEKVNKMIDYILTEKKSMRKLEEDKIVRRALEISQE